MEERIMKSKILAEIILREMIEKRLSMELLESALLIIKHKFNVDATISM